MSGRTENTTRVLHVAAEMAPLAKVGGLGDVVGSLPKALNRNGVDARVLLPMYPGVQENADKYGFAIEDLGEEVHVALDWRVYSARVLQAVKEGLVVYLLDQPELFTNPVVYPTDMTAKAVLPFVFLSYAALELTSATGWRPDLFHVHDWSSALLPIALRWHRHYKSMRAGHDVVITLHNLAHQGIVDSGMLPSWGLTKEAYAIDALEFYGQANILKGGIIASDGITTVSPHYSWDIQTQDGGLGLQGVFTAFRSRLTGILNGIDYDVWNPLTDKMIPANFSKNDLAGKAVCRRKIFETCGWKDDGKPLIAFVGRMVQQKGIDILFTALDWMLVDNCRAVIIGSGTHQYEEWAREFQRTYPDFFWTCNTFDEEIAHLAYAGSDMLFMPSLFEPCGLSQMIAMAYGTIPIARSTGGLADTIIDFDSSRDGTGFLFTEYSTDELLQATYRAIDAYNDKERWNTVIGNAMNADFSWDRSTAAYINLYNGLKNGEWLA